MKNEPRDTQISPPQVIHVLAFSDLLSMHEVLAILGGLRETGDWADLSSVL